MKRWTAFLGMRAWIVALTFFCVFLFVAVSGWSDVISIRGGKLEGRILENSAIVLVVETVAGEYLVVEKTNILTTQDEPITEFYFRRGRFYEGKGEDNRALLDYLEAVNLNPNHKEARERIDAINYKRKKMQWDQGLQNAQQFISSQEYRKALSAFQDVLALQPDDQLARQIVRRMSDTHAKIAFTFYDHCYDEGAVQELAKAEELNPNSAEIYYVLGKIHESDRKYELARLEYERALELEPNHSSARNNLMILIQKTRGKVIQ